MQAIRNKQATWSWGFVRRCRKVCYYRHQAPKKHSKYCFVERKKMDGILTELNLETLAAVFQGEIIVPSIVQSMRNDKIDRLGVTAIGDRVWLHELCKEKTKRTTAGHRLALEVLEAHPQAELAIYLKLTLYWRNECIFSTLGVLGCGLKVQVFLASLFSLACKWIHVHLLLFYFVEKFF